MSIDPTDFLVNINKIEITGNNRTKPIYFENELKNILLLNNSKDNKDKDKLTLYLLHLELQKSISRLKEQGIFDSVNMNIDIKDIHKDNITQKHTYNSIININIKEKSIPFLKLETYIKSHLSSTSSSEVGMEVQGAIRNILGLGDIYKFTIGTNPYGNNKDYLLSMSIPHIFNHILLSPINRYQYRTQLETSLKSSMHDMTYFLGYKSHINSFNIDYTLYHDNILLNKYHPKHHITFELASRDEIPVTYQGRSSLYFTNAHILSTCTPSTKVATKYTYTITDTRDSIYNPTSGSYLQSSIEVASTLGTTQYIKPEIITQTHIPIGHNTYTSYEGQSAVLSLVGSLGVILPLSLLLPSYLRTPSSTARYSIIYIMHIYSYHLNFSIVFCLISAYFPLIFVLF